MHNNYVDSRTPEQRLADAKIQATAVTTTATVSRERMLAMERVNKIRENAELAIMSRTLDYNTNTRVTRFICGGCGNDYEVICNIDNKKYICECGYENDL